MSIITKIIKNLSSERLAEIDFFRHQPSAVQNGQFKQLIKELSLTEYGRMFGITDTTDYSMFTKTLPVVEYNDLTPFITRHRQGESNILIPGNIGWYAKSSGTTDSKSKFIPVPKSHLERCHYRGTKDVIAFLTDNYPNLDMFSGKALTLGGSHTIDEISENGAHYGDLSAILIQNAPFYTAFARMPAKDIALISNFDEKIEKICESCVGENITSIAGVPSWNLVMLGKILEYTGKKNICEVWENMEVFMHGGVNFNPYRSEFQRVIPSPNMKYIESYNASEGFFSIQDEKNRDDMLLMLDYGIFYEFLAMSDIADHSKTIPLEGVEVGVNYAMIISTLGGLWRYMIGDTVVFTSTTPYKIKITGRTKLFINAFGEEIIIDNADKALSEACRATKAEINEYTAAPVFMQDGEKGSHEWIIEFRHEPDNMQLFCDTLDKILQNINSDYEAKRHNNTTLLFPRISNVPKGTFFRWMERRGRVGGQNKVPRLSNDRKYVDDLLNFINA